MAGSTISSLVTISVTLGSSSYPSPLTITPAGHIDPSPVIPAGLAGLVATISGGYVLDHGTVAGGLGSQILVASTVSYSGGIGVDLAGGSLTNTGGITGGIGGYNKLFDMGGTGGYGVVATSSSLTNDGTISGGGGYGTTPNPGRSINYGGSGGSGVDLTNSSLTNKGLIVGGNGASSVNGRGIGGRDGSGGNGVVLSGSSLTNNGTIVGGNAGAFSYNTPIGPGGAGVTLAAGSTLTNTGDITGGTGGSGLDGDTMVSGPAGNGVDVESSSVTNEGTITGGYGGGVGVALSGGSILINKGNIGGGGSGQSSGPGGTFFFAGGFGVEAASSTIINDGGIGAGRGAVGVDLTNGILTNNGVIASGHFIVGEFGDGNGVDATGGTLTNNGTITSYHDGVSISGGGTVVNAGTTGIIPGPHSFPSGPAVFFGGAGTDLLIDDPGAVFVGSVVAQGSPATLDLASSASVGTIVGIGTSFSGFGTIAVDADATWAVTGSVTGSGTFDIGAGSDLTFGGGVDATSPVHFTAATGTLGLGDPADFAPAVYGLQPGDAIDFTSITSAGSIFAGVDPSNHLTLTSDGILLTKIQLDPAQNFAGDRFHAAPDGHGGTLVTETPLCFLEGTLIATPSGEVRIEQLGVGDMVVTARGVVRPIVWIGTGRVLATRYRRSAATPIIVRKSALADNVPHYDLRVTRARAFSIDGVLIPAEFLVNHRSILWDDRAQEVALYHIALETHDVLVANGAPAESYRDNGNRWLFRNANSGWDLAPQMPCAPVLTGGRQVDAVWRRLLDRAGPARRLPLTQDADLHLVMDG
jgi:hypothetical protein